VIEAALAVLVIVLVVDAIRARRLARAADARADRLDRRLQEVLHEGRLRGWNLGLAKRHDE
jgi:hypothetical protein